MPADRHEFSLPERRQSRRSDVRLHHRAVRPDEWIVLHGMPVTRPSRIAADMLDDKEDPEAVAQVIVDALRPADDYPGTFADALAPYAVSFTLRRGDGLALLRWLLDTAGDPEMSRWIQEARAHLEQFRREGRGVASCSPRRSDASMTGGRSYANPGAFRRALTDKLRVLASQSQWTLQQLQRQMAYDRLLERLYLVDEGWIIKGATALLARDIGVRGTIDIDLYCLTVLAWREVSKDADTRGGPLGALGKSTLRAEAPTAVIWYLSTLVGTMYPWR